ncbi:MAG: NitrOD5 domain-containing protein [Candidatus Bathyarchaeota archaeon]
MSTHKDNAILYSAEKALKLTGNYFKPLLVSHLKRKFNSGLDIILTQPGKFHDSVAELFGEYTARLLENLIVEIILKGPPPEKSIHDFSRFIQQVRNGEVEISANDR